MEKAETAARCSVKVPVLEDARLMSVPEFLSRRRSTFRAPGEEPRTVLGLCHQALEAVEGLGELVAHGAIVEQPGERPLAVLDLEGFGQQSVANLLGAIEESRRRPLVCGPPSRTSSTSCA